MKKLITGAITAIAILLGFAACSGDLHDNDVQPLYVVGIQPDNGRKALTIVDSTTQELKFTYKYNSGNLDLDTGYEFDAWSNTPGQIAFKITKSGDPNDWSVDWGGINDDGDGRYASVATVLSANAKEFTALNMRGSTSAPTNPGNVFVYDLVDGVEYTLSVEFNAATNHVGIKIAGESSDAPDLQLVANQKYTVDSKEEYISYPMTRAGTTYTYEFIAANDIKDFKYYVKAPTLGSYYIPSGDELVLAKEMQDNFENNLDENGNITNDTDYALDLWKSKGIDLTKNAKYKITITANHISQGFGGKISIKTSEENLFADAQLLGNWKYADSHDHDIQYNGFKVSEEGVGEFVASNSTVEFKILRESGDQTMVWGAESANKMLEIKYGENNEAGKAEKLTYKTTYVADKTKFAYVEPEKAPEKNAFESVGYIKASGLTKGKTYQIALKGENAENMTISIAEMKDVKFHEEVAEAMVKGAYDGWANSNDNILKNFCNEGNGSANGFTTSITEENGVYTYKISLVNKSGDDTGFSYGVFSKADSDGKIYKADINVKLDEDGTGKGKSDVVEATFQAKDSDPQIKGVPANAEFDIIIIADDNTKKCKIQVVVNKSTPPEPDKRSFAQQIAEDYYVKGSITDKKESYHITPKEVKYLLADGKTETDDESKMTSATITFGPFDKKDAPLEWILTDDSTSYGGSKIRYTDTVGETEQKVQLVKNEGKAKITELASLTTKFYYIVITAKNKTDDNKTGTVYANLKATEDSELPYPLGFQAFIIGDISEDFVRMTNLTDTIVSYTFEYADNMTAWGSKVKGKISFIVNDTDSWNGNTKIFRNKTLTLNSEYENSGEEDKNVEVAGLVAGHTYTILVDVSGEEDLKKAKIIDGKPLFIAGGMNGWNFEMLDNDADGAYFLFAVAANEVEFKVNFVPDWIDGLTAFAGATIVGSTKIESGDVGPGSGNAKVTAAAGNKLYISYDYDKEAYFAWVFSN
ncbi:MAG: hypothetical protein HDR51_06405 [Treponema sp.]|nr:hypothetical protein [Treponema sp.]